MAKKVLYNAKDADMGAIVANIESVYNVVKDANNANDLLAWYGIARSWCADVALDFGLETRQVAGIVAVFSPQLSWEKNKFTAREFMRRYVAGESFAGLMAYKANVAKACRIMDGEAPESVIGGRKVSSFFNNIMGDTSTVTVDRHALHIALYGVDGADEKSGSITPTDKLYSMVEIAYRTVAENVGIAPMALQSITWSFKAQNGEA